MGRFGNFGDEGKAPVPKTAVMGAEIPDDAEMMKKRSQHSFIQAVDFGDCLPVSGLGKIFVPARELPKGQYLGHHPDRWKGWFSVGVEIMANKGFIATVYFVRKRFERSLMFSGVFEVFHIKVSMGSIFECQVVAPLRTQRYLDALNRIQQ